MIKWFKSIFSKPPKEPAPDLSPYICFSVESGGEFDIEIGLPHKTDQDKQAQCLAFIKCCQQIIKPEIYPVLRLCLEKMAHSDPEVLVDTKVISNLLLQLESRKTMPHIRASEVFMPRGSS